MTGVFSHALTLLGRHWIAALGTLVLLTTAGTIADTWLMDMAVAASVVLSVVTCIALGALSRRVLRAEGLAPPAGRLRYLALFGLCFFTNAAIGLGVLLLVVPGLYVAARWSICVPILLAESRGITDAMLASAARTRPHVWHIVGLLLLLYVPALVMLVAIGVVEEALPLPLADAATNLVLFTAIVVGWFLAIALYAALAPQPDHVAEEFA